MDGSSTVRTHPIYLMLDVSESMRRRQHRLHRSALEVFAPLLDRLVQELAGVPRINSCVWVSMLAFSDDVQVLRQMKPVVPPDSPEPVRDGQETDYVKALRFLLERCPQDQRTIESTVARTGNKARVSRPLIFLITDGAPYANRRDQSRQEWLQERNGLVVQPIRARIAAISLSSQRESTLWQLATGPDDNRNAFIAAANASPEDLALSIKESITVSIQQSVRATGEFQMRTPRGMTRVSKAGHA